MSEPRAASAVDPVSSRVEKRLRIELLDHQRRCRAAISKFDEAFQAAYPVDSWVEWSKTERSLCGGTVLSHGCAYGGGIDPRLFVRNEETGKEYWIFLSDVERAR